MDRRSLLALTAVIPLLTSQLMADDTAVALTPEQMEAQQNAAVRLKPFADNVLNILAIEELFGPLVTQIKDKLIAEMVATGMTVVHTRSHKILLIEGQLVVSKITPTAG